MRQKCNLNLIWVMLIMGIIPINRCEWVGFTEEHMAEKVILDPPCCPPALLLCCSVMPILGYMAKMRRNKGDDDGDDASADDIFGAGEI